MTFRAMVPLVTSSSVYRERKEGGGQEMGKENKEIDGNGKLNDFTFPMP